ncbi:MAG TPA: AAA family ATPase, partial [Solirubrobacteraceae bacterium]
MDQARAELEDVRFHLLETVAQAGSRLGPAELGEAEDAARRAVTLSPFRDSARAALIEVLRRRGNVAEALVAYDEFRLLLREELGSLPGPELRELHARLVSAEPAAPPADPAAARAPDGRRTEQLLEREDERAFLRDLVARAAAGDGTIAVLEGQAGVGKTELLRAAAELGQDAGMSVLRARGSELDRDFGFGVVRQLFAREVMATPELLAGGAELAGPALAPGEGGSSADLVSSLEALHWLVVNLSARRPVLLLADDVHWADRPSLRWLVFLAERIEDVPVLLVAATRPAEPGADQELLDALATAPAARALRPAPLSEAATAALVRRHLPEAEDGFAAACHQATGGNPFLLGELLREAIAEGRTGVAAEAADVHQFGAERVGRAIRRRLRLQPPAALTLARAVAVLGRGASLAEAAALAGLEAAEAARASDALAAVDLLAAGGALDFVHPLVRSAVYEQIAPREREALHLAAAELLRGRGAESERVATHLLRVPAAPEHVAALRAAAREALGRGATEAAALYLRRAIAGEPADEERATILHELARAEAAGLDQGFREQFTRALEATRDPEKRGRIALDFGTALTSIGNLHESTAVFRAGLEALEDPSTPLGVRLEAEMMAAAFLDFRWRDVFAEWLGPQRAKLEAGEALDPVTLASLLWSLATGHGPAQAAIDVIDRILAVTRLDERGSAMQGGIGNGLMYLGELSRAGRYYDEGMATAQRMGARTTFGWQSVMRSIVSLNLGELRRAESEARFGFGQFADVGGESGFVWTFACLTDVLVARGAVAEAEEVLAGLPPRAAVTFGHAHLLVSSAGLHLALGRPSLALQDALKAGEMVMPAITNPAACAWRAAATLALLALDRRDEARAMAEQELADARRFAFPLVEGGALRSLGLATGGAEGVELLRASVATLERSEGRFSHARSVLELGAALRRAGERAEAREVLREALAMTSHMGASGLADRAHEELAAAGARPSRERRMLSGRESLTASEDRVAVLA